MNISLNEKIELVNRLKKRFEDKGVSEIIQESYNEFGDELAMTTAFGYSGIVLMSFVREIAPDLAIYFIDTRKHFDETIDLMNRIRDGWELNITSLYPYFPEETLEGIIGRDAVRDNPDLCCHYRKVEPLLRILGTKRAWLSAVRRDQSRTRSAIEVVEIDGRGTIKISPLWNWTSDQAWEYIRKNDLPYNALCDQNYPSIGCKPCTEPVEAGGDERDGRWKSMSKLECGIHV